MHAKMVKSLSHTTTLFHDVLASHERPNAGMGLMSVKKDMKQLGPEDKQLDEFTSA